MVGVTNVVQIAARLREVIRERPAGARAAYLEMVARQGGDDELADAIATQDAERLWSATWAHWRPAAGYQVGPQYPELKDFALMSLNSGALVIAACREKALQVWDLESGQADEPITGLQGFVWSLAVGDMNGKPIAVTGTGSDPAVQTWDLESRKQIGEPLIGHTDYIYCVAITEISGRPIAVSGSSDHTVRVWDLEGRKQVGEPFAEHNGTVRALAVAAIAGRPIVVSAGDDHLVRVWDLESRQQIGDPFVGHDSGARLLAIANMNGKPIVVSADSYTLLAWDLNTRELICDPVTHNDSATELRDHITGIDLVNVDGHPIILTCGQTGTARMWQLGQSEPVGILHSRFGRVIGLRSLEFSGQPVTLLGHENGRFWLWPLRPNGHPGDTGPKTYWTDALAVTESNGQSIAISTGPDRSMRLWDVDNGMQIHEPLDCEDDYLYSIVQVELDGRPAAVINGYKQLQVWWLDTYTKSDLEIKYDSPVLILAATDFQGSPLLVSGHKDGTIRCTRLDGQPVGSPLVAFTYRFSSGWDKTFEVWCIAACQLSGAPVAVAYAGAVQGWNLEQGKKLWQYMPNSNCVTLVGLGDDIVAASGGDDGEIRTWRMPTGEKIGEPLVAHQGSVMALLDTEFFGTPTLVSGGNDGTVRIWDLKSRAERIAIDVGSPVYALAADSADTLLIGQRIGITAIRFNRSPHDTVTDRALHSVDALQASEDEADEAAEGERYIEQIAQQMLPLLAPEVFTHGTEGFSLFSKKAKRQRPKSKAEVARSLLTGTIFERAASRHAALYEEAIRCFGEALRMEPDNVRALRGRGAAYRMRCRYDQALADLTRALDQDPDHVTTMTERAITLRELGRYDESADDLSRALRKKPDNFFARRARGVTYRRAERYEEALADLDRAAKEEPSDILTRKERGETCRLLYRFDAALADLDEALKADPNDVFSLRGRGSVYRSLARFDEALTDFTKALGLEHPQTLFSLCGKAGTLAAMGRADDAEEVLHATMQTHPQSAYLQDRYGSFLSNQGRYAEAHRAFDSAATMVGQSASVYLAHKVETLTREGHYEEAVQLGKQAVAADPKCRDALGNLGDALICLGQPNVAIEYLDRAIEVRAGREPLVLKGVIHWHAGDHEAARDAFDRAGRVADDCTLFRLAELLAIALAGLGQPEQAVQAVTAAMARRLPGDVFRPALYDLLEDPHMKGIGRVRSIIERDWER